MATPTRRAAAARPPSGARFVIQGGLCLWGGLGGNLVAPGRLKIVLRKRFKKKFQEILNRNFELFKET